MNTDKPLTQPSVVGGYEQRLIPSVSRKDVLLLLLISIKINHIYIHLSNNSEESKTEAASMSGCCQAADFLSEQPKTCSSLFLWSLELNYSSKLDGCWKMKRVGEILVHFHSLI